MSNALDALLGRIDDPALQGALSTEIEQLLQHQELRSRLRADTSRRPLVWRATRSSAASRPRSVARRSRRPLARRQARQRERQLPVRRRRDNVASRRRAGCRPRRSGRCHLPLEFPKSIGLVERGGDRAFHTVLNAENYHALELLRWLYPEQIDCIWQHLHSPFPLVHGTGKYNNDYVDAAEISFWHHSKSAVDDGEASGSLRRIC